MTQLNSIAFSDRFDGIENILPGTFRVEMHFDKATERSIDDWMQRIYGASENAPHYFPGNYYYEVNTQTNPPTQVFHLCDCTQPAARAHMQGVQDRESIVQFEKNRIEQIKLKSALKAPSVPSAVLAQLLGKMMEAYEIDRQSAITVLSDLFEYGPKTAEGLIDRSLEHIRSKERGV